jgi:hypothetical protein
MIPVFVSFPKDIILNIVSATEAEYTFFTIRPMGVFIRYGIGVKKMDSRIPRISQAKIRIENKNVISVDHYQSPLGLTFVQFLLAQLSDTQLPTKQSSLQPTAKHDQLDPHAQSPTIVSFNEATVISPGNRKFVPEKSISLMVTTFL